MSTSSHPPRAPQTPAVFALCVSILVLGAGARIWGYLTSGALWMDELFIANNLVERGFAGLLQPLDYGQNAPVGWLWIIKATIVVGGESERMLRLPGLLASLAALPLTFRLTRRALGNGAIIPVTLVSCSPFVVWQGLQVKQYSFDVLVALLITAATVHALDRRRLWPVTVLGVLGIYVSMPAIFVCAAAGFALLGDRMRGRAGEDQELHLGPLFRIGGLWIVAFLANYFIFLRPRSQDPWLYDYWAPGLFPWPLDSGADLIWVPKVLAAALGEPAGYLGLGLAVVVLLVPGCAAFARPTHIDAPTRLQFLFVSPILLTLGAAIAGVYPFTIRLVLFLVPGLGVLLAMGAEWLAHALPRLRTWVWSATGIATAVPVLLLLLWLPRGGMPLAADTAELFRTIKTLPKGEPVLLEHIAVHARRFYGGPNPRPVQELPAGWSTDTRVAAMQSALEPVSSSPIWLALIRVREDQPLPLEEALAEDLRAGAVLLPKTYRWFEHGRKLWSPSAAFAAALPEGWRITERRPSQGCCLWKLERAK